MANQKSDDSRLLDVKDDDGDFRRIEFFEDVLDRIGGGKGGGKFQKRWYAFVALCAFLTFHASSNHVFATYVPDHWCHVPGRELTNYTVEEWKSLTLPSLNGTLSQCEMLLPSVVNNDSSSSSSIRSVPCDQGWDYDTTWFTVTIPVDQNWVCDRRLRMQHALAISGIVCTVLVVFVCYSGDRFGRKIQYALSFSMLAVGRSFVAFTPSIYALYIALLSIGTAGIGSAYECVISLGLELASTDSRGTVNSLGIFFISLGKISCALIAWHLPHYKHMLLATSLPLFVPLALVWWVPESPRWLTGKGRCAEAFQVLQRVARVNGKELPPQAMETLRRMSKRRNVQFGVTSLVTNRSLRRNTAITMFTRFASILAVSSIGYNLGNVPMNPFLMQIAFGVLDIPSIILCHFASEKFGRRWSHCFFLLVSVVCSAILLLLTSAYPRPLAIGAATAMFYVAISCALFVCYLQSLEIHPTCVRQSAGAVELCAFTVACTLAPYVAHLHVVTGGKAMYGLLSVAQFLAAVAASFLPETLHRKLPETLEDADKFGAVARYWSFRPTKEEDETSDDVVDAGKKFFGDSTEKAN